MRILFVVLAGLVGWLWFATREPEAPSAQPATRARRADLTNLRAQVVAATTRSPRIEVLDEWEQPAGMTKVIVEDAEVIEWDDEARDVEDRTEELTDEEPTDEGTIGHEVIIIEGHVPIIDTTTLSGCRGVTIEEHYIKHIPVPGRTFESVLGAAADSQGQEDGVVLSSGAQIENTYFVEDGTVYLIDENTNGGY